MSNEIKEEPKKEPKPQIILSDRPFPYNVRRWVPDIEPEKIIPNLKHPHHLTRVVQYNILCDSLLPTSTKIVEEDLDKLPYLSWENRSKKILSELKTLNADLIGLTEIEKDENFIKELNSYGYEFAFKPRTGAHSEGCALAWKNDRYELIDLLSIGFNMNKDGNNISEIYGRDNIALISILKVLEIPNTIILFATTHLLFNVKRGDIKLGQTYQLVNALEELRKKYEDELKNKVYTIFVSDLNCIPRSGVYKLLTTGSLDCNNINKIIVSGQDPDNLQYVNPPTKIISYLLKRITPIFKEEKPKKKDFRTFNPKDYNNFNSIDGLPSQENVRWFNDICRIKPVINDHCVKLDYNDKYIYKDTDLILKIPLVFKSAYSVLARNCLNYFKNEYKDLPFNLLENFDNIEVNGIKMGKKDPEKTDSFVQGLTLENPFSCYCNDTVMSLDYIFYNSKNDDIKVARILNCPEIFKLFFDIGYMPNEIFPSDHFSIAADLILGGEK